MNAYLKQNIEWVKSFVSETYINGMAGKASSRRVFEAAIIWGFLIGFVKVTIATTTLLDMPWGWATTIMGILGLKVYERVKNSGSGNGGDNSNGDKHDDIPK